jgi:glycosyltransferase involved in cell wall biosynthesis
MKKLLITTQRVDENDPILGFFVEWIKEFAKHYDHIYVVCLETGTFNFPENVVVSSMGKERGSSKIVLISRFYRHVIPILFQKHPPNKVFIHMNSVYAYLLAPFLPMRVIRGIRVVWWKCHGHATCLTRNARFFVDEILTCSKQSFPVRTKKKKVIGHGIRTDVFSPKGKKIDHALLSVGRMVPSKRYEEAIEAVHILRNKDMHVSLEIVGGGTSEESAKYYEKLVSLVDTYDLKEHVTFTTAIPQQEIVKLFQRSEVFVHTSGTDSVDKVVLEAMACGAIPISSNISFEDILDDYGLYISERNPVLLAERIEKVLSLPKENKDSLRKKLRSHVLEKYSLEKLIKKISNI